MNTTRAIDLIQDTIANKSGLIVVHSDIDIDGIGTTYILYKFLQLEGITDRVKLIINKERDHGITNEVVRVLNNTPNIDLVVILDSSSNSIDLITDLKTSVLVVDHHNIEHGQYIGKNYIIINNSISTPTYQAEKRMSAGLLLYELLRHYYIRTGQSNKLDEELMFNWVFTTLITDSILLDTELAQYYIQETLKDIDEVEHNLRLLLDDIKQVYLNKNTIQYYIAPRINATIRAKQSLKALNCIVMHSCKLNSLDHYRKVQQEYTNNILSTQVGLIGEVACVNLSTDDNDKSVAYCGVVASKLGTMFNRSAIAFKQIDGYCRGSFRGKYTHKKYIKHFTDLGVFAQGHDTVFGFKATQEELIKVLESINEPTDREPYYLTAGSIGLEGKHHIKDKTDMDTFKRTQKLLHLGILNSRLSTQEAIYIHIDMEQTETEYVVNGYGVYEYNIKGLGLTAICFTKIQTKIAKLYVEYNNSLVIYIKEHID